jgi:vitamin-K-epoxide reductase (warfarin-sensitive)
MILSLLILAILGFCISLYSYIVDRKIKATPDYKPACDISDRISCSKPLQSPYAHIFFFSNSLVSMVFYVIVGLLAALSALKLLFIISLISCMISCILAYILYVKIKALCLICTSLYGINALIFVIIVWLLFW